MKSRAIFICLLMFCCFWFMGCDEFGVLSLEVYFDFLLPKENKCVLHVQYFGTNYEVEDDIQSYNEDDVNFIYKNNENTEFLEYYDENPKKLDIFFWNDYEYLETRKNYRRTLSILIKGYVEGEYKEELLEYPINIEYLEEIKKQQFDFQLETECFGTVYGLFCYKFTRYI